MANLLSIGVLGWSLIGVALFFVVAIIVTISLVFPLKVWWRAKISGAPIAMSKLLAMKMRKVDLNLVVVAYITAKKSGLDFDVSELETHVLAGGNIDSVVRAMISAKSANLNLTLQMAMAIDLAGRDVYQVVQNCIMPKVVETPQITAVAKDGIEVKAKANITILGNIKRVLGGADESTIILRVSEALSSTIGSALSHGAVLENPDVISDCIMGKGLDYETSYEIMSIDIYELSVGKNIAAERRMEQVELDRKKTANKLEERRLEAIALEQENKAKIQEMKAKVVAEEAEVPKALIKALNEGKISPVDYYDIQNLQADTKLRNSLCPSEKDEKGGTSEPELPKPKIKRNPFNF